MCQKKKERRIFINEVHLGKGCGFHPIDGDQDGKIGTRRQSSALLTFVSRVSLAQKKKTISTQATGVLK